jgi:transposase
LPAEVQARVARAEARGAVLTEQIAALEAAQRAAVAATPVQSAARRLAQLQGVAGTGTAVLLAEGLVWRGFRNRREVGGLLGFTPQPYQSGGLCGQAFSAAPWLITLCGPSGPAGGPCSRG